ncbi:MAG: molybdopterin-dependent oxidoreductase [Anaerolineae bacterium]|nr:molybdopterin-dependent oxidoreductase [Anaerolineae bacterium]
MDATISFTLNGRAVTVRTDPVRTLLEVLRNDLGLTGTKQGCDLEGECGACTVLLDGVPVRSCLTPVGKVEGREVLTVEGLGDPDRLHPLQKAFAETGAVQCGYCTPGMLMSSAALLARNPSPSRQAIIEALEGNLCRCTGYARIIAAVELAAARMRGESSPDGGAAQARPIGGDLLRVDIAERVTGRTQYVEDMPMPDALHMRVVRSPHLHARVVAIDTQKALEVPGVLRVLTAADIPGENSIEGYSKDETVLVPVGGTVKMVGDAVALVIATTPEAAQAGVAAVEVAYEPLPALLDPEEALAPNAVPIHADGNVLSTFAVTHGDANAALAASDAVVDVTYRTSYLEHATIEREAALGYIDEEGRITVVSGTHEPHWHRDFVAPVLGLEPSQVRVIMPPTGGSFGKRQDPWLVAATALAVYHMRRSVRIAYTRRESFDASPKRHPYVCRYTVGATRDGTLTGLRLRVTANTGAYDSGGYYIPNYAIVAGGGAYRWQGVDAFAQSVYTNGPKAGQMRGYGTPQSNFALECTLDEMIQRLGDDPVEFRLRNAIAQHETTWLGYPVAESLGYRQVLEAIRPRYQALETAARAFNESERNSPWRKGVGLAGMWYRFGKYGIPRVAAEAELGLDGRFVVYCSAPDYGQGTATVMVQLAAETLGVSRAAIRLVNADTATTLDSSVPGASRATYWVGGAVCRAVTALREVVAAVASEMLDCPPSAIVLADDRVMAGGDARRSVRLSEVAAEMERLGHSRKVTGVLDLRAQFPNYEREVYTPHFVTGAQVAEVLVNTTTGQARVTRVVAAHDVGHAINPRDAQGQIEGAIVMGLGAALMEEFVPGVTTGFSDYYIPTAKTMPDIEVILVEVPSYQGPFGAKGLGEAPILPTAPAIINAISRAVGARIREIPATPERILAAARRGGLR